MLWKRSLRVTFFLFSRDNEFTQPAGKKRPVSYYRRCSLCQYQCLNPCTDDDASINQALDVLVGTWPVVVYLAYYMPQVLSANYAGTVQFRKSLVIKVGFMQRLHILLLACSIALWGLTAPSLALALLFLIYLSNQATSGSISPIWMDFFAKTTSPERRGKIMGWRVSLAAVLALVNGFLLTFMLTVFRFPYNYASAIGLAFLYQMSSLAAQRNVVEEKPSPVSQPIHFAGLFSHVKSIIARDRIFRKFLFASALLTLSFSAVAFFTIAAMKRFDLTEYEVGLFTVVMIVGQILSGVGLGWLADAKGTKSALVICGSCLVLSIATALFAQSVGWYYLVFLFFGINFGAETAMRYNYAVECAPEGERSMYVGVMNGWFAPFYLLTPCAGLVSASYGYQIVFLGCFLMGLPGLLLLILMENPYNRRKLALSSK
jgi:MFS family permease